MNAARLRPGYTLLEVLLATAIGVMLLAAVYVALDMQLSSAQAGRDVIEQTTLARSVLARMSNDISLSLGTVDPGRYRRSGGQGGGFPAAGAAPAPAPSGGSNPNGGGTSGGNTGQSGSGRSPSGGSSGQGGGGASPTGAAETSDGTVNFNLYVQGTSTALTLYVSRMPRELTRWRNPDEMVENPAAFSDLRRVTYWLAGGDVPLGLARQEIKIATSDDALGPLPPDIEDEASYVIPAAETIQSLQFSYFDGTQWLDSWDGLAPSADGMTPLGPPRAIAIVLGIAPPPSRAATGETELQYYRHVIAVPTANGPAQQSGTAAMGP